MSLFASILACLLALLAAGPACRAAVATVEAADCSCCCGDSTEASDPGHRCPCVAEDPLESPEPPLPPPPGSGGLELAAPPSVLAPRPRPGSGRDDLPRWVPARPWHAPPAERRARLVLRTL